MSLDSASSCGERDDASALIDVTDKVDLGRAEDRSRASFTTTTNLGFASAIRVLGYALQSLPIELAHKLE